MIVPGGVWNPDPLRADAKVIGFLQAAAAESKIVAAVCHGPWVLSDAGLLRGKRATAWWSIKPDLVNAGATFIDEPAITDGKIVTARAHRLGGVRSRDRQAAFGFVAQSRTRREI